MSDHLILIGFSIYVYVDYNILPSKYTVLSSFRLNSSRFEMMLLIPLNLIIFILFFAYRFFNHEIMKAKTLLSNIPTIKTKLFSYLKIERISIGL